MQTLFITPGSPRENGYVASFNGKLHEKLLGLEVFETPLEAHVLIERWRKHYNAVRPRSSIEPKLFEAAASKAGDRTRTGNIQLGRLTLYH